LMLKINQSVRVVFCVHHDLDVYTMLLSSCSIHKLVAFMEKTMFIHPEHMISLSGFVGIHIWCIVLLISYTLTLELGNSILYHIRPITHTKHRTWSLGLRFRARKLKNICSQICIKRSTVGQTKNGLLRHVTS
jgi:hypothetical protein